MIPTSRRRRNDQHFSFPNRKSTMLLSSKIAEPTALATRRRPRETPIYVAIHDPSTANFHLLAPSPARKPSGFCAGPRLGPVTRKSESYGESVAVADTGSTSPDVAEPAAHLPFVQITLALVTRSWTSDTRSVSICLGVGVAFLSAGSPLSNDSADLSPLDGDVGRVG